MKKFVIASHGTLAKGMRQTLELFVGNDLDITYMSAYIEGEKDIDEQINTYVSSLSHEDQVVVFTDMYGGSVNQKFTLAAEGYPQMFIVAGFNLPVMLEIIYGADTYTRENLQQFIEKGQEAMQLVEPKEKLEQNAPKNDNQLTTDLTEKEETKPLAANGIMPTTLRVDERLIHGQIAMVWSKALNLEGILVANDEVSQNDTQQMALKMAVPSGIKVLIRSVDEAGEILQDLRAPNKRLLVLVKTIKDAVRLAEQVPNMSYINIGNVGKAVTGEKETLTQFVMLTAEERQSLAELVAIYPETALQNVPSDKKELAQTFLEN